MKSIATLLGIALMTAMPVTSAMAQQTAPASQSGVLVGSDSLVGSAVRNTDGHDIGKVNRLMIDPADGRIVSLIITTGGTMGVGSNTISVPWGSVKVGQDRGKVIVIASQTLETAPRSAQPPVPEQPRRQ